MEPFSGSPPLFLYFNSFSAAFIIKSSIFNLSLEIATSILNSPTKKESTKPQIIPQPEETR